MNLDGAFGESFLRTTRAVVRIADRGLRGPIWRRSNIDLARSGGLGDVLMCTAVLRRIKRRNPACHIRFFSGYPSLSDGLPYIDEVLPFERRPLHAVPMEYRSPVPPGTHLAQALGASLGVEIPDVRPDCIVRPGLAEKIAGTWRRDGMPLVVFQRRASDWTSNKDWPTARWHELAGRLSDVALVETGTDRTDPRILGTLDMRGRTSIDELAAAVSAADLVVGPDSGLIHLAAAVGKPSVTIYGGYLHPSNTAYRANAGLYTQVDCAPCWLREPCPYGLKCMAAISAAAVEAQVRRLLAAGQSAIAGNLAAT